MAREAEAGRAARLRHQDCRPGPGKSIFLPRFAHLFTKRRGGRSTTAEAHACPCPAWSRVGARRSEMRGRGEGRSKGRISLSGIWGDADRLTATPSPAAAPRLSPALNTRGGERSDPARETPAEHCPASCSPAGTSRTSITSGTGACHAWATELRAAPAEGKPCPKGLWFYGARLRDWPYEAELSCPLPSARCPPPTAARTASSSAEKLKISRSPAQGEHGAASSGALTAAALVSGVRGCF